MANIIKFGGGGGGDNAPKAIFKRVHSTSDTSIYYRYAGNGGITIDIENQTFKTHSWDTGTKIKTLRNDFLTVERSRNDPNTYIVTFTKAGTYSVLVANYLEIDKKFFAEGETYTYSYFAVTSEYQMLVLKWT